MYPLTTVVGREIIFPHDKSFPELGWTLIGNQIGTLGNEYAFRGTCAHLKRGDPKWLNFSKP